MAGKERKRKQHLVRRVLSWLCASWAISQRKRMSRRGSR